MKNIFEKIVNNALPSFLFVLFAISVLAAFITYGVTIYKTVISPQGSSDAGDRLVVVGVVMLAAFLLAFLRYKWTKLYGLLQIAVGMMAAWSLTGHPLTDNPLANGVALLAVAFLMARRFYDEGEADWKRRDERKKAARARSGEAR